MAYGFASNRGRTDGREIRPHKPWQVNTGRETANRTVAPGAFTPRTDFASVLAPRLGGVNPTSGPLAPILGGLNPTSGPLASSATLQANPPGGIAQGEDQATPPDSFLAIPTDAPQAPPMFAGVSDTGVAPGAPPPAPGGWTTTNFDQREQIRNKYGSPQVSFGGVKLAY